MSATAYQVSTPRYTCLVIVDAQGIIQPTTARYLKRWYSSPWDAFVASIQRQWRQEARVTRLQHDEEDCRA